MAADDEFDIEMEQQGNELWLRPSGDLDLEATGDFRDALSLAARSDASKVVIDLRELQFMDSTGLGVLVRAVSGPEGTRFAIVPGGPAVQRVIELSGLTTELPFITA